MAAIQGWSRERASEQNTTGFNPESRGYLSRIVVNGIRLPSDTSHGSRFSVQANIFRHGLRGGSANSANTEASSALLLWSRVKTGNGAEKLTCVRDGLIRRTLVLKLM